MTRMVPPGFVDDGPKLRVLILTKCYKPEMAKNQGEHRKMTHSSETEVLLHPLKKWIFGPKMAKLAQKWIFSPFGPMPDQKTMQTRCLGDFFRYAGTKTFAFSSKNFLPKNDQNWFFGHSERGLVGSFGALLVGWLKVVPHGLYLARHLFTLLLTIQTRKMSLEVALLLISYVCELFFCYSRFVVLVLEDTGFEMRRWIQILIRLQFLCPLPHT